MANWTRCAQRLLLPSVVAAATAVREAKAAASSSESESGKRQTTSSSTAFVHGRQVPVHAKRPRHQRPAEKLAARYSYIIIGYGVAGRAALASLLEVQPGAHVLVVDALHSTTGPESALLPRTARVDYLPGVRVRGLDAQACTASLERDDELRTVGFDRCLVAVGATPPPVPSRFVAPAARAYVSALRSRAERVEAIDAVCEGEKVAVLGSSWGALELAASARAAAASAKDSGGGSGSSSSNSSKGSSSVMLIFPEFAPLDHLLPKYLTSALLRRLERCGIDVLAHSTVRYIGKEPARRDTAAAPAADPPQPEQEGESLAKQPQRRSYLRLFLAKAYDHLETHSVATDRVIVAGFDALPSGETLGAQGLETDAASGGIVVNAELMASSRVWCAGDAAFAPGPLGRGIRRTADNAHHAGTVAGLNMGLSGAKQSSSGSGRGFHFDHVPIYCGEADTIGVSFMLAGEGAATVSHGFWWTNTMVRRWTTSSPGGVGNEGFDDSSSDMDSNRGRMGAAVAGTFTGKGGRPLPPVYGTGVVFNCTADGRVLGVMLWGAPQGALASKGGAAAAELLRAAVRRWHGSAPADPNAPATRAAFYDALQGVAEDVVRAVGVGNGLSGLQRPLYRFAVGRSTTGLQRSEGRRDELLFQNSQGKTDTRARQLERAYAMGILGGV